MEGNLFVGGSDTSAASNLPIPAQAGLTALTGVSVTSFPELFAPAEVAKAYGDNKALEDLATATEAILVPFGRVDPTIALTCPMGIASGLFALSQALLQPTEGKSARGILKLR